MDRRSFLTKSALGGTAAAAAGLATPALAQSTRKLTMVTTWPRGFAGLHDAAQKTADLINAMSDGSLEVELKAAGELVGAFEVFDAVSAGQADMYHAADYYFIGQHPGYGFFTSVPFGMTAPEVAAWYYHGGGQELHDELGEVFNLKSFLAGNTGAQAGGWFRKQINSPDDFNGLRFRMPGLGGQVLTTMGASIQNLPGGEIYQALSSGAIDGTEWVGPWSDESAGFQEITKIYYTSGMHEPGSALTLATNREVFDSLTAAQQAVIETASAAAHQWNYAQYLANNGSALDRLSRSGVEIYEFPDSVWDAMGAGAVEVLGQYMDDDLFKKIHDSYMASMRDTSAWVSTSEGAYTAQRNRVLG